MLKDLPPLPDNAPKPHSVWKHYKKQCVCTALHTGYHTETGEILVFYREEHSGLAFARPLSLWHDLVDGVPRFAQVSHAFALQALAKAFADGNPMLAGCRLPTPSEFLTIVAHEKAAAEAVARQAEEERQRLAPAVQALTDVLVARLEERERSGARQGPVLGPLTMAPDIDPESLTDEERERG